MNRLAIFDIDGTLTDTYAVDDECYRAAIGDVLGVAPGDIDWTGATHITDSGIFSWLYEVHRRSLPSALDVAQTRDILVGRLEAERQREPGRFVAIAGAANALWRIEAAGWRMALATGCWEPSARLKLAAAQLAVTEIPLACADDAMSRVDIVRLARARAESVHQCEFTRVVAIGDGLWDVDTAVALGLPFVGIGQGPRADLLSGAGAGVVLADYTDVDALMRALETAAVPRT